MDTHPTSRTIAALNDGFRRSLIGGRVYLTRGVTALGEETRAAVLEKVRAFDVFNDVTDPYGEHDFGAFKFDGQRFFWKIEYYDTALEYHSEDAADPSKTTRVLTVMLADEY